MARKVTTSIERHLVRIYKLQKKNGIARTSELAKLLGVVPGTITNTTKRLMKEGFVVHQPYKGVKPTKEGRRLALHAVRKHQVLERLLTEILHVVQALAHEVAFNIG